MAPNPPDVTRLAPSPTGAFHLGNARTFVINYLLARQRGWKILMRIEDLDGPRIKRGADRQALEDLGWLGIDWDEGPAHQSATIGRYHAAAERLLAGGHAYPCVCTRSEVDTAASAPHAADGAAVYPGTCRGRFASVEAARAASGREPCLRFRVDLSHFDYEDGFLGPVHLSALGGDFVIQKADGTPAYQLACALDDAESGVTQVVRGDDLVDSVPRQVLLMRALGFGDRIPTYTHLPLVIGPDGRRLAKRHGDTRLATYRARGVTAGQVLTLLARWSGMPPGDYQRAADLLSHFDLARVPRTPITMHPSDL